MELGNCIQSAYSKTWKTDGQRGFGSELPSRGCGINLLDLHKTQEFEIFAALECRVHTHIQIMNMKLFVPSG